MVRSAQTVHLYCTDSNSVSKRIEMRFHMTHSPRSSIRCVQGDFLSLWYVQRKLCTYIAPTLTLFPNRSKQDSTWPSHLGVPSGASKMISKPMLRSVQPCTYIAPTLTMSPNGPKRDSIWPTHLGVPSGASKKISEPIICSTQTMHLSSSYIAPALTLSPNWSKQDSTWPTSPRSSILCVQNVFRAYGTCDANCATILRLD
jgi:uncharacterized protein YbdZ (MbtH family)